MIQIDETFLKNNTGHIILTAVRINNRRDIFPLAVSIVSFEN